MTSLLAQSINLFAVVLLVLAFAMIAQRRILTLIHLFTLQGAALAAATLIVAYLTGQHHLYYSAVLTFVLKVILIPILLHRAIGDRGDVRSGRARPVDTPAEPRPPHIRRIDRRTEEAGVGGFVR